MSMSDSLKGLGSSIANSKIGQSVASAASSFYDSQAIIYTTDALLGAGAGAIVGGIATSGGDDDERRKGKLAGAAIGAGVIGGATAYRMAGLNAYAGLKLTGRDLVDLYNKETSERGKKIAQVISNNIKSRSAEDTKAIIDSNLFLKYGNIGRLYNQM